MHMSLQLRLQVGLLLRPASGLGLRDLAAVFFF